MTATPTRHLALVSDTGTEPAPADTPRVMLTPEQAAESLGIGRTTMYALIKTGDVESVKIGRLRRVPQDALEAFTHDLIAQQHHQAIDAGEDTDNPADTGAALILSLHPRHAEAIVNGTKTVELRRRPLRATPGTRVLLYATTPTAAVLGTATLHHATITSDLDAAWQDHGHALALTRTEYDAYLAGATQACLIHLTDPHRLDEPLRLRHTGFRPPHSLRYLAPTDPERLHGLAAAATRA
jgi:excisionase family DNA binding protein